MLAEILNDRTGKSTIDLEDKCGVSVESLMSSPIVSLLNMIDWAKERGYEDIIVRDKSLILAYCQRVYGRNIMAIGEVIYSDDREKMAIEVYYSRSGLITRLRVIFKAISYKQRLLGFFLFTGFIMSNAWLFYLAINGG